MKLFLLMLGVNVMILGMAQIVWEEERAVNSYWKVFVEMAFAINTILGGMLLIFYTLQTL